MSKISKIKVCCISLCLVLLSSNLNNALGKDLGIPNIYDSIIVKSIQENKDYFLKLIETKNIKTRNESLLLTIIYGNNKANYNGKLVYDLIRYDQENHGSIFIEDSVITRILLRLAANPTDNGTDEEYSLIDLLMVNCRPDYIKKIVP